MVINLLSIPVTAVRGTKEGERLEESIVVVLVEPQDVHNDLLSVGSHGLL